MSSSAVRAPSAQRFQGNDKLLLGLVLALLTFWLFAASMGTVAPSILADINKNGTFISPAGMNLAVSITSLISGLLIVLMGGLADRVGRVKIALIGTLTGIVGSLFLLFAAGPLALPFLVIGRAIQGFSAACIMPSTLAIVKAYWDGAARQRAVSMWSIGTWGGSGLAAIFGGSVVQFIGWKGLFIAHILLCIAAFLLIRPTPETKAEPTARHRFDFVGLALFIVATLTLMIVVLFGSKLGSTSASVIVLVAISAIFWILFVLFERRHAYPFIDFALFKNKTFSGATLSNFLLNCSIGTLIVSQQLLQLGMLKSDGSKYTAFEASLLTIGYAVCIIAFIRVGEKLLQRFGPRKPMMWGILIVLVVSLLFMQTYLLSGAYRALAIVAYCLFGVGLAFYATPSTDAALSNLPPEQSGAGAGIYKMASSLGAAVGTAVSLTVFTAVAASGAPWLADISHFSGTQANIAVREAGMLTFAVNAALLLLALGSVIITVPKTSAAPKNSTAPKTSAAPQPKK
ncbi:MAG: MFS transporter [Rothia sp. (in: high G+C Gram-positive bacteria)]|nr:MFS transporter [Rothia sp. (in: high G+C Gram-positive bacteria)]